jgi:hypothetical protein
MQFKGKILKVSFDAGRPSFEPSNTNQTNTSSDNNQNTQTNDQLNPPNKGPITRRSPFRINNPKNQVPNISVEMLGAEADHMPDRNERRKIRNTFFPPNTLQPENEVERLLMDEQLSYLHMLYVVLAIKSGFNMQQIKAIADPNLDIDIIKNMFPALKSGMNIYDAKKVEKSLSAQEVEKRMKSGESVAQIFDSVPDKWKETSMYQEAFEIYSHMEMDVQNLINNDPNLSLSDAIDTVHKEYLHHNFNGFDPFH